MKIIVLTQDNCGWCVRLHPHITKLTEDFAVQIEFINITNQWDLADKYELKTTPTVIAVNGDDILRKWSIEPDRGVAGLIAEVKEYIQYEYMW